MLSMVSFLVCKPTHQIQRISAPHHSRLSCPCKTPCLASEASMMQPSRTDTTTTADTSSLLRGTTKSTKNKSTKSSSKWFYFKLFSYCNIEDALISVGKMVSTFSGAFNGVANGAFRVFSDSILKSELSNAIATYESAMSSQTDAQNLGVVFGQFFQKLFEMEVPSYQYNDFTTS